MATYRTVNRTDINVYEYISLLAVWRGCLVVCGMCCALCSCSHKPSTPPPHSSPEESTNIQSVTRATARRRARALCSGRSTFGEVPPPPPQRCEYISTPSTLSYNLSRYHRETGALCLAYTIHSSVHIFHIALRCWCQRPQHHNHHQQQQSAC